MYRTYCTTKFAINAVDDKGNVVGKIDENTVKESIDYIFLHKNDNPITNFTDEVCGGNLPVAATACILHIFLSDIEVDKSIMITLREYISFIKTVMI